MQYKRNTGWQNETQQNITKQEKVLDVSAFVMYNTHRTKPQPNEQKQEEKEMKMTDKTVRFIDVKKPVSEAFIRAISKIANEPELASAKSPKQ